MATIPSSSGNVTLMDFARSLDPDGTVARVVECLNQTNEILEDMAWIEGNLPTGHQSTLRSALPTAVFRKLYGGVPTSKSGRTQVVDTCGYLEARSEIDQAECELNGNTAAFRFSEAQAFLEGRAYVVPQDVKGLAPDILRHRIMLSYEAEAENLSCDDIIKRILDELRTP